MPVNIRSVEQLTPSSRARRAAREKRHRRSVHSCCRRPPRRWPSRRTLSRRRAGSFCPAPVFHGDVSGQSAVRHRLPEHLLPPPQEHQGYAAFRQGACAHSSRCRPRPEPRLPPMPCPPRRLPGPPAQHIPHSRARDDASKERPGVKPGRYLGQLIHDQLACRQHPKKKLDRARRPFSHQGRAKHRAHAADGAQSGNLCVERGHT